jgi:hypothetical protein
MIAHIGSKRAEDDDNNVKWYFNLLTGSFLACRCNLPWVFNCLLFLVPIKQEKGCKHNRGFLSIFNKN